MLEKIFEDIYFYLQEELTKRAEELLDIKDLSKLSVSHAEYLEVIRNKGKPTLSEIAQELNFSKPSVTTMINKLIEQGFVKKLRCEDDKRVFYVELTDLGRNLNEIHLNNYREFASSLKDVLEDREVERLAHLLSKGLNSIREK